MKHSYLIFLFVAIAVLASCRPRHVLSPKQMEDIFVDLHMADGVLSESGYNYGHDEALKAYYNVVLAEHGTTQAQFDSSLVWYTRHPNQFDKIYPKVVERLTVRLQQQDELLEAQKKTPILPDSALKKGDGVLLRQK